MDQEFLIINPGSASKKYAWYLGEQEQLAIYAETTPTGYLATIRSAAGEREESWDETTYTHALDRVLAYAQQAKLTGQPAAVGIRVVAPGQFWQQHRLLDETAYQELLNKQKTAPLHLGPAIAELNKLRELMPQVKTIAVSDSAFHATMPAPVRQYGLPKQLIKEFDLYRFGYHGISFQSVIRRLPEIIHEKPKRVIICHLGSGTSIAAIQDGQSIDTSMGFSPLAGIITGTRASDIDAGALMYLARGYAGDLDKLEELLNKQGGLLAVSGQTDDIRQLIKLSSGGDQNAALALDTYTYQVRKFIGAYMAVMGGLDYLIFTATVGVRSALIRAKVCQGLKNIGIAMDPDANENLSGSEGIISAPASPIKITVVKNDELGEMARIVQSINLA